MPASRRRQAAPGRRGATCRTSPGIPARGRSAWRRPRPAA
ncbi:hypothetical protein L489_1398 [Bordetella bronchiseptica 00-P-2730]|nr:hypothetical protein L489_1398 [Bordetella bronchiseptica 00-P-2730]